MPHDLEKYLDKLLDTLSREVNHLFIEASKGPLHKDRASALVNYIKVLSSVQQDETKAQEQLQGKSEEELKALALKLLK
jgi:hypothetical protein